MVGASKEIEEMRAMKSSSSSGAKGSIANDLVRLQKSPASAGLPEHVLIVMDGLEEFSLEPLQWVLENIALMACCTITILGVMPWLNIPLSSKTWTDIWAMDVEELVSATEWRSDMKHEKVQQLINLCRKYGVVPQLKREMGYPPRVVVIKQITSNRATLVVFDRHHDRRNIEYYADHVPCNMVRMNEEGEMDFIKGRSHLDNGDNSTPSVSVSTTSMPPTPKLMISETWKKILKLTTPERRVKKNKG